MPWIRSCLCHQEKKKPSISPPIHLLLKSDGPGSQNHAFRCKVFKKPRPCHLCHQPILHQGSCCRVCKYVCHKVCETKDPARYTDTSWQIHSQWRNGGNSTVPSPTTPDVSVANGVSIRNSTGQKKRVQIKETIETIDSSGAVVRDATRRVVIADVHRHVADDNISSASSVSSTASTKNDDDTIVDGDISTRTTTKSSHTHETAATKNGTKVKQTTAVMTSQPHRSASVASHRGSVRPHDGMDLSYVTERIIALWFPADVAQSTYRQGQRQAAHMLHNKHGDNYMVFNLSEPRRAARSEHERVHEVGWPSDLAPPLERLCSVCKDIDSWLSGDKHRIAVLHARGSKERLGVIVAAYMHYSSICGTADQALDRFAMRRFLDDTIGTMELPSNKRYVEYFSGLLSGNIRINAEPLYLTHVTVLGAPAFDAPGGCRAFLKVYEGLLPVYTSGVYSVSAGMKQFTVNVAGERQRHGLQLRGDILIKCYHRRRTDRETIFSCQFHTCAVSDYTLSFTRQELDAACNDLRFPLDGAVELHFSKTPETRLPSPAPTPAVPVELSKDPITRYNSYENLGAETTEDESDADGVDGEVNHTYGPLDGSIYATIAKKPDLSPGSAGGGVISSPLTVSMDSGISSAGHQQASHGAPLSNNTSNASSSSPPPGTQGGTTVVTPLTPEDRHRELDELLNDMLLTVENIPDMKPNVTRSNSQPPPSLMHRSAGDVMTSQGTPTPGQLRSYTPQPQQLHRNQSANGISCEETLQSVIHTLDSVSFIDDDCEPTALDDRNIPYHARQDSRPFTYGALPAEGSMIGTQSGLASPSLVRKASFGKSTYDQHRNGTDTVRRTNSSPYRKDPIEDMFTAKANDSIRREEFKSTSTTSSGHETLRRSNTEGTLRRPSGWERNYMKTSSTTSTIASPYSDTESLSPPGGFGGRSTVNSSSLRSPDLLDGSYTTSTTNSNLTWLQRQQQKLKERREIQLREERQPHETRLISELRTIQHTPHRHMRPTASHRLDGYTSDTTAFADDDEDFTIPLHINTTAASGKLVTSSPASPILPHRTSSRKYTSSITSSSSTQNNTTERPFVAVKRAHEQTKKYSEIQSPQGPSVSALAANPLGYAISRPESRGAESIDSGLLSVVEQQRMQKQRNGASGVYCEESYSSWRTTSMSEVDGSPPPSSTSPRPQTPAFPVHPRTPYSNNSTVQFDTSQGGLPPKSPTTLRKDISASPLINGNTTEYMQQHTIIENNTVRSTTLPPQSTSSIESYQQHSPKSPTFNGSSSPTMYYGHSRRSSVHSNSEPPQEVAAAHVKFVRDTSKYWYKPTITREEAISLLRDQPPGTFVVRDSNSFPGAFGMALKVATPPPNVQTKTNNGDELVRHFLIEPTSKGVRLKGCSNEPVFSSLSALVYQHSVMTLALPSRLLLPEGDVTRATESPNTLSTAQQLLTQGAACNVLYLFTYDMESLTGPQAIRKAVAQLFIQRPLTKATIVHFKVSGQGITLTDNKRKLFFRRHYPASTISHCGLDPDDHRWNHSSDETGMPISSNRCFGFVAKKPASNTDNQCHIFAELEPEQPATAIVNFVSKVMMVNNQGKANIV